MLPLLHILCSTRLYRVLPLNFWSFEQLSQESLLVFLDTVDPPESGLTLLRCGFLAVSMIFGAGARENTLWISDIDW
jgi:hypothetical protein